MSNKISFEILKSRVVEVNAETRATRNAFLEAFGVSSGVLDDLLKKENAWSVPLLVEAADFGKFIVLRNQFGGKNMFAELNARFDKGSKHVWVIEHGTCSKVNKVGQIIGHVEELKKEAAAGGYNPFSPAKPPSYPTFQEGDLTLLGSMEKKVDQLQAELKHVHEAHDLAVASIAKEHERQVVDFTRSLHLGNVENERLRRLCGRQHTIVEDSEKLIEIKDTQLRDMGKKLYEADNRSNEKLLNVYNMLRTVEGVVNKRNKTIARLKDVLRGGLILININYVACYNVRKKWVEEVKALLAGV